MKQGIAAILIVGLVSTWSWNQNRALQNKVQNREEMDGTSQRIDSRK